MASDAGILRNVYSVESGFSFNVVFVEALRKKFKRFISAAATGLSVSRHSER